MEAEDRRRLIARLGRQSRTAAELGSPLYAHLFDHITRDVETRGPCWQVLRHHAHEPDGNALPLRFGAAVHRLVLRREAPALALHYPSVGGEAPVSGVWQPFLALVEARRDDLVELSALACQTNEVGRSASLAPAFLATAGQRPIHHLELGTSAGLNLRWDRFRYGTAADGPPVQWGDAASPVDLRGHWLLPPPSEVLPTRVRVVGRRGCDPNPPDPSTPAGRETLTASVWPDQRERHERLRGALEIADEVPAEVTAAPAGEWLADALAARPDDALTIVSHSVVWRYIAEEEQRRIERVLAAAGAAATPSAPLAWIRLEPRPPMTTYSGVPYPVTVTTWPGGVRTEVAEASAHGADVRWLRLPA